jgi:hypothetical protein
MRPRVAVMAVRASLSVIEGWDSALSGKSPEGASYFSSGRLRLILFLLPKMSSDLA